MPSSPLEEFLRALRGLDYTRTRMERLFSEKRIVLRDLHSVYEALFIKACCSFEAFLEGQFFAILEEKANYKKGRNVVLRMMPKSSGALRDILLQGDSYLTWVPFSHTEERAKLYLQGGRPFSDLSGGDRARIKTVHLIRNAIAHRSDHARKQFDEKVIGEMALLPGERKPAGFLRSQVRASPVIIRFEVYMQELAAIAQSLC